ncbi:putative RNA recognition motif domain, nucleotide-binding alpha-beta plait domain superfamily [Helianthus annuus]|nr:putative RNA recognition motif domain, nucleotide-binding alpha-beta plait domain superfamily [Helianthus annuus]
MGSKVNITKFYITNLPVGCRPWDVADFVAGCGEVAGMYIVRKKDKGGRRFGFLSLRNVKDARATEKVLNGLKMGGCNLRVNIAKYAAENAEWWVEDDQGKKDGKKPVDIEHPTFGGEDMNITKSVKDGWLKEGVSFKDMLKKEGNSNGGEALEKMIEVHSETSAFFDLQGRAVVGRALDIPSITKMKVFLKEAGLWFSSVDMWAGQTMQYERVAWLKFHGMPLHLAENKVFDDVAGMFGKVIEKSQLSLEDNDLSVNFMGILVDHGNRISDSVTVKWKNKRYKIWILEERDEWVPDCLSEEDWPEDSVGDDVSVGIPKLDNEKSEKAGEEVDEPLSQNLGNVGIEGNSTFHEVGKSAGVGDSQVNVGRNITFSSVSGEKNCNRKKPFNIAKDKHKSKPSAVSPELHSRPKKRTRVDLEESYDSFGLLGRPAVEKVHEESDLGKSVEDSDRRKIDLNKSGSVSGGGEDWGVDIRSDSQPDGKGTEEVTADLEDGGSEILKEIDATVFLGNSVGVNLRNYSSLVEEAIINEGNNVVNP